MLSLHGAKCEGEIYMLQCEACAEMTGIAAVGWNSNNLTLKV